MYSIHPDLLWFNHFYFDDELNIQTVYIRLSVTYLSILHALTNSIIEYRAVVIFVSAYRNVVHYSIQNIILFYFILL